MTRDETIALFERCKAAQAEAQAKALDDGKSAGDAHTAGHDAAKAVWNGWAEALLAERKALEESGRWASAESGWFSRANADFSRCCFLVRGLEETEATAGEVEDEFEPTEPPVKTIDVEDGRADFGGFLFPGHALFGSASFSGDARFGSASFSGAAWFGSASFSGPARFASASFSGAAWFGSASFSGPARFASASFSGTTWFDRVRYSGDAWFSSASFSGIARFDRASFSGTTWFDSASFSGDAWFESASFSEINFKEAKFGKAAYLSDARFVKRAVFEGVHFAGNTFFIRSAFQDIADFSLVKFDQYAGFEAARFFGPTNFNAVRGDRAFTMADASFDFVPDFIQAHFEEAPRLDNVTVDGRRLEPPDADDPDKVPRRLVRLHRGFQRRFYQYRRVTMADRDVPARWRALKRLAIQAHDQDREHDFFAREIRSERFVTDWPWPRPIGNVDGWLGFFRFVFGYAYGLTSNYGRSVLLPFLWWCVGVAIAANFYFGVHQDLMKPHEETVQIQRMTVRPWGELPSEAKSLWYTWWTDAPSPCYAPDTRPEDLMPGKVGVIALSRELRDQTSARWEAFQLALRDGFLILYGDADTAHRTYGCLYGIELYSASTPVAIVPPRVGQWSAVHKLYSAVMIFLFGLALRNMLKMK